MLELAFWVAWLAGPALVIYYRQVVVPRRFAEVLDAFGPEKQDKDQPHASHPSQPPRPDSANPHPRTPQSDGCDLPIVLYAKLMRPYADHCDAWAMVKEQFMRFHGWKHYVLPLVLLLLLTGISLHFCYSWVWLKLHGPSLPPVVLPASAAIPAEVVMALLGAFLWSLYEILNRRRSGDLTPDDLYDIAVRQLIAVPIGYAFSALVFEKVDVAVAFVASAFPLRDLKQILRQRVLNRANEDTATAKAYENQGHISQVVDGLSIETAARLEELHISTAMDLAYTDPVRLMVRTGFSIRHVLAWIDEAMVSVYFGPQRAKLRDLGIPCALDICEFYKHHCFDVETKQHKDCSHDPVVLKVADELKIPALLLPERLDAIYVDPHVRFLAACWYRGEEPRRAWATPAWEPRTKMDGG